MKRALITGVNGFVGRHLERHLEADGWDLVALERDRKSESALAVDSSSSHRDWVEALQGIDTVFHLAGIAHRSASEEAYAEVNTRWPVDLYGAACDAGVRSFVFLSSIKVFGDTSTHPFGVSDPYHPADAYARSKVAAEHGLVGLKRDDATRLKIVRPPLVYGPGVKANFLSLLRLAKLSRRGVPLPLGGADALRSMVGVENLCALLMLIDQAKSTVFHVSDGEDVSVVQLLEKLGGRRLFKVPRLVLMGSTSLLGKREMFERAFCPMQIDQSATLRELNWYPPSSLDQQLRETMEWYLQR